MNFYYGGLWINSETSFYEKKNFENYQICSATKQIYQFMTLLSLSVNVAKNLDTIFRTVLNTG